MTELQARCRLIIDSHGGRRQTLERLEIEAFYRYVTWVAEKKGSENGAATILPKAEGPPFLCLSFIYFATLCTMFPLRSCATRKMLLAMRLTAMRPRSSSAARCKGCHDHRSAAGIGRWAPCDIFPWSSVSEGRAHGRTTRNRGYKYS